MNNEFLEPWHAIPEDEGQSVDAELYKEVIEGHPLFGKRVKMIARRFDCDDILVKVVDEEMWAYVHLTWTLKPEKTPKYPFTIIFENWEAVYNQLILVDNRAFTSAA